MKRLLLNLFSLLFIFVLVFLGACTKNVAGPQGDPGTPGRSGNVKQSHISSIIIDSTSWTLNADRQWESTYFLADIDRTIVEKGEVELYLEADGQWWALPYGKGYIFTQYSVEPLFIRFNCSHIHGGQPDRPANFKCRVVIFSPAK